MVGRPRVRTLCLSRCSARRPMRFDQPGASRQQYFLYANDDTRRLASCLGHTQNPGTICFGPPPELLPALVKFALQRPFCQNRAPPGKPQKVRERGAVKSKNRQIAAFSAGLPVARERVWGAEVGRIPKSFPCD